MLRLIQNEYIKIFKKKSSIVLLILFIIGSLGLPVLTFILSGHSDSILTTVSSYTYDSEIQYYEGANYNEYVNMLKFLKDNKISLYSDGSWEQSAAEIAFSLDINPDEYLAYMEEQNNSQESIDENNDLSQNDAANTTDANYNDEYNDDEYYDDEYYDDYDDNYIDFYKGFSYPTISFLMDETSKKESKKVILDAIKNDDPNAYFKLFTGTLYEHYKSLNELKNEDIDLSEINTMYYAYKKLLDEDIDITKDEWALDVANTYGANYQAVENYSGDYDNQSENEQFEIAKYRLENKVSATIEKNSYGKGFSSTDDFYGNMLQFPMLITLAGIIIFMMGIGIISKEYNQGTIKFLLINPVKRSSIFWSKVITLISMLVFVSIWVIISQFLVNMLLTLSLPGSVSYFYLKDGELLTKNGLFIVLMMYFNNFINVLMFIFTAVMLSSIFKNGALSTGSVVIAYLVSSIGGAYAFSVGFDLFKVSIFNNMDLYYIYNDWTKFTGQTLKWAIAVYVIHMIIFLWTARDSFVKKDI